MCCFFCFFKQKTAYEMRISDWSSDVCSSDLYSTYDRERLAQIGTASLNLSSQTAFENNGMMGLFQPMQSAPDKLKPMPLPPEGSIMQKITHEIGRASCRERVCPYV